MSTPCTLCNHLYYFKVHGNGQWSDPIPVLARTGQEAIMIAEKASSWLDFDRLILMRQSDGAKIGEWPEMVS